jgi:RNA polymerase subunit RPABC4/transcription elongation factor Spt4
LKRFDSTIIQCLSRNVVIQDRLEWICPLKEWVGVPRFHVATWFGNCSYCKLKVTAKVKKNICPICESDLVKLWYFGSKRFVLDRSSSEYKRDFLDSLSEGDREVWVEAGKSW